MVESSINVDLALTELSTFAQVMLQREALGG